MEWELAMTKAADGTPVERTAARRSLAKSLLAVQAAGGRVPNGRDGRPMLWSEAREWFERGADDETVAPVARPRTTSAGSGSGSTRSASRSATGRSRSNVIWSATRLPWPGAPPDSSATGLAPQPGLDAPAYMLVGWRLHRRGMYDPPASL
jgi:hypothetical protein